MSDGRSGHDVDIDVLSATSEASSRDTIKHKVAYRSPVSTESVEVNCVQLPDLAAVIPFCEETRSIYLVQQVRPALVVRHGWTTDTEIPAGFVNSGENPNEAAIRELREETGLRAVRSVLLCEFVVSPGFTGEKTSLYFARVEAPESDTGSWSKTSEGEVLRVREVKLTDIPALLEGNQIHSALTCLALNWCLAHPAAFDEGRDYEGGHLDASK